MPLRVGFQAMCDYEDEAYYEDDDALSAYYRAEAEARP